MDVLREEAEVHLALGVSHFLHHRLEAILEFAAVLGAGDQRADVLLAAHPPELRTPCERTLGKKAGDVSGVRRRRGCAAGGVVSHQAHELAPHQRCWHVVGHDALRQRFADCRLAHTGFADQHGVVLRPP
jgi:hypothetical protein